MPNSQIDSIVVNQRIQFKSDSKENWSKNNPVLLKAEIGIELDTGKFKFGDGVSKWNDLSYSSISVKEFEEFKKNYVAGSGKSNVFIEEKIDESKTDLEFIVSYLESEGLSESIFEGDIFIINKIIDNQKIQSPYVYQVDSEGSDWYAMNSLFDSDRILIDRDFKLAGDYEKIGNIKVSDGKIASKGKTLNQFFTDMFCKIKNPIIEKSPSIKLKLKNEKEYEIGTIIDSIQYSFEFDEGKYSFNSTIDKENIIPVNSTGVSYTNLNLKLVNGNTEISQTSQPEGFFDVTNQNLIVGSTEFSNFRIDSSLKITDGNYALTNTDELPEIDVQIKESTLFNNLFLNNEIKSYKKIFFGYSEFTDLTSDNIRSLNSRKAESMEIDLEENQSAKSIIIAIPAESNLTLKKVIMPSSLNLEITQEFSNEEIAHIFGASQAIGPYQYSIWKYEPDQMGGTYKIFIS